jgi:hypothetical protein
MFSHERNDIDLATPLNIGMRRTDPAEISKRKEKSARFKTRIVR